MPFIQDENENHILDKNGNKIEYTVVYEEIDPQYKHREPIHVNDDGHLVWRVFSVKIQTINSNIQFFNSNIQSFNSNIQFFNSNIQSFNSTQTFNPSIQICNCSVQNFDPSNQI